MEKKSGYWKVATKRSWNNINKVKQLPKLLLDIFFSFLGAFIIQWYLNVPQITALITIITGFSIWILFFIIGFVIDLLFFTPSQLYSELKTELEKYRKKSDIPIIIKNGKISHHNGNLIYKLKFTNISETKETLTACSFHVLQLTQFDGINQINEEVKNPVLPWTNSLNNRDVKHIDLQFGIPETIDIVKKDRTWTVLIGGNDQNTILSRYGKYKISASFHCKGYYPEKMEIEFQCSDDEEMKFSILNIAKYDRKEVEKFIFAPKGIMSSTTIDMFQSFTVFFGLIKTIFNLSHHDNDEK